VLREIMRTDDQRSTWELGTALGAFDEPADRNPLLDEAWARLPFDEPGGQHRRGSVAALIRPELAERPSDWRR
jgi:hypothetical protein